jgi:5'-3' exonuclease
MDSIVNWSNAAPTHFCPLLHVRTNTHIHTRHSMKPCFVFDGKAPNMKSGELQKRREKRIKAEEELKKATEEQNVEEIDKQSKRLARAGRKENADCQKLLRLMGVPVYVTKFLLGPPCLIAKQHHGTHGG